MKAENIYQKIKKHTDSSIQTRMIKNFGWIVIVTIVILEIIIISVIHNYYYGGVEQILKDRLTLTAEFLNKSSNYSSSYDKASTLLAMSMSSYENKFLVQFIDSEKKLIIDSNGFSDNIEISTPDVEAAFNQKFLLYRGVSSSTGEKILSASRPLIRYNTTDGVIRFVVSLEKVESEIRSFVLSSITIGVMIICFFLLTATVIARSIVGPIKRLNEIAKEFAKGNFDVIAEKKYDDEVGQLVDTINFMSDEIKNTEKLKIEFISSISHELRTPLTSIKGWSETLQMSEGYMKDSDIATGLNIISAESERLSTMVEELLDFSRFQSNSMKIKSAPVNVKDVIFQVYMQFSNKRNSVSLKCDLKGEDTIINADENRLKQIYINLLTNAIKFSKEDGEIEMTAVGYDDKIVTTVKDNGIGIKKENIQHITEKFYKGSSTMPGNGLGLAIVDELVKLQSGKMIIESDYGVGTTVMIEFPAIKEEDNETDETILNYSNL